MQGKMHKCFGGNKMFCSKCGLNNKSENQFCSQCGSVLMPAAADQDFSQEEKIVPVFKPMTNPEFITPEDSEGDCPGEVFVYVPWKNTGFFQQRKSGYS